MSPTVDMWNKACDGFVYLEMGVCAWKGESESKSMISIEFDYTFLSL